MTPLLIRCEATPDLGTGHALRCLALAQEWMRRGERVVFAMANSAPAIIERLRVAGAGVEVLRTAAGSSADATETAALAHRLGAKWTVVDGPALGAEWDAAWAHGAKLLRIDDNGLARAFRADLVLNQNLGATASDYPQTPAGCRNLLGPRFALLRPEFLAVADCGGGRGSRVVVTLGGSDPACATERVFAALLEPTAATLEADFIIGAGNPRQATLRAGIDAHSPRLQTVVAPADLPRRFAAAPLAVTAGGTTIYELALLHTPMLLLCTADNQRRTCTHFAAAGAAQFAGWHAEVAPTELARMLVSMLTDGPGLAALTASAGCLVDGRGASRVVDAMCGGAV
ncbi:MAG TPA: UDP-2,4-diacetamido-2,4,6-trideoxy-beta-L-altropyranose hydrolase [Opitutaceae bacterium]|nr:UDP-2,4-diacetamido-2,4,6-trideoxy-beta-L-altropyranose hydrolase [Opitutaceae bacterium]